MKCPECGFDFGERPIGVIAQLKAECSVRHKFCYWCGKDLRQRGYWDSKVIPSLDGRNGRISIRICFECAKMSGHL